MLFNCNATEKEKQKFYEAEEQQFLNELNNGEFSLEILENEGLSREEKEVDDVKNFYAYLESDDFKSFCQKAHTNIF